jgi:hypothetical protein
MQTPVMVLNTNTSRETGRKAQLANIAAAKVRVSDGWGKGKCHGFFGTRRPKHRARRRPTRVPPASPRTTSPWSPSSSPEGWARARRRPAAGAWRLRASQANRWRFRARRCSGAHLPAVPVASVAAGPRGVDVVGDHTVNDGATAYAQALLGRRFHNGGGGGKGGDGAALAASPPPPPHSSPIILGAGSPARRSAPSCRPCRDSSHHPTPFTPHPSPHPSSSPLVPLPPPSLPPSPGRRRHCPHHPRAQVDAQDAARPHGRHRHHQR